MQRFKVIIANSADPDEIPQIVTSHLDQHCLLLKSDLYDASLKGDNLYSFPFFFADLQFFLLIEGEITIQGSVMSSNGKRGIAPLIFKSFSNSGNFHQVLYCCLDSPLLLLRGLNIRISELLFKQVKIR